MTRRRRRVFIYAAPFGFGPTGKAIIIARRIADCANVVVGTFSSDVVEKYHDRDGEIKFVQIHSRDPDRLVKRFGADAFDCWISVMEPRLVVYLAQIGITERVIFFDSLLSWRKYPLDFPRAPRLYIAQYFSSIGDIPREIPANGAIITKPVISPHLNPKIHRAKKIVANFGGMQSPYCNFDEFSKFVNCITKIMSSVCERYGYQLEVFGNNHILQQCDDVQVCNVLGAQRQEDFFNSLLSSTCCIATPGVETYYEATSFSIPVLFLPPTNSTQLFQLGVFNETSHLHLMSPKVLKEIEVLCAKFDWTEQSNVLSNYYNQNLTSICHEIEMKLDLFLNDKLLLQNQLERQKNFVPQGLPCALGLIENVVLN